MRGVVAGMVNLRFAETVHLVAFSCITIFAAGTGIGFWSRQVEAGMEASPFCRRAHGARRPGYPNMLRTDLEGVF
jgi:hypothetical protein